MPYAQSQQGCPDCQFCRNCDPTPGRSPQRQRDCRHNKTWTYIEPNTPAAAKHICPPKTTPASGRTAGKPDVYENIKAKGYARAHFGKNYAREPQNSLGATYRGIEVGDNTVTHHGDNIGYPDLETERLAKIPHLPKDQGHPDYRDRSNDQNGQ